MDLSNKKNSVIIYCNHITIDRYMNINSADTNYTCLANKGGIATLNIRNTIWTTHDATPLTTIFIIQHEGCADLPGQGLEDTKACVRASIKYLKDNLPHMNVPIMGYNIDADSVMRLTSNAYTPAERALLQQVIDQLGGNNFAPFMS